MKRPIVYAFLCGLFALISEWMYSMDMPFAWAAILSTVCFFAMSESGLSKDFDK